MASDLFNRSAFSGQMPIAAVTARQALVLTSQSPAGLTDQLGIEVLGFAELNHGAPPAARLPLLAV